MIGNPFRPVALDPRWLTSTVLDLARTIYDERVYERMPILADALMDAGCDSEEILSHCRSGGPHVRGCWVVDLRFIRVERILFRSDLSEHPDTTCSLPRNFEGKTASNRKKGGLVFPTWRSKQPPFWSEACQ